MSARILVTAVIVFILGLVGVNSVFIITELERAVLLEFGRVVRADIEPGLHLKKPFINEVRKFDARVLTLDITAERFLTPREKSGDGRLVR
jgi:membrane protease subunit HflC